MSRLVLHIGTHKTATTSIQRFFHQNRAALAERGVWYPDYSLIGRKPHYAHLGMVNGLSGRHDNFTRDEARAFFAAVRERVADHDLTVISGEPFYRHVAIPPDATMPKDPEAYWTARRDYVTQLRELFGEAEIVVVFRRQADYAQSLYQEQVKVTRYRWGFKAFLREFWFHFRFLEQVRAWEAGFGAPRVLGFERLRETGDIPGAFAAALGIDAAGLDRPGRQNEGLLTDLVVLKRMLHATGLEREEVRARIEALQEAIDTETRAVLARRSFFDGPNTRRDFQKGFEADNARLAAYAPDLAEGEALFPGALPGKRLYGDKLTPVFLDFLSRRALSGLPAAAAG